MGTVDFTVHIKVEPCWEGEMEANDALRVLYAGHVVKEELVLGPELMQPSDSNFENQDSTNTITHRLNRTCSVTLEPMMVDMKHNTCKIGGQTYNIRQNPDIKLKEEVTCDQLTKPKKMKTNKPKKLQGAKYCCNECQYSTKRAENLLKHLNTHNGVKPFKCRECDNRFSYRCNLKTHLRIHTGEKPFKCNQCVAAFSQRGHLNRHLKRHLDEKPYACEICGSKFKDTWSLLRHQDTHTGKKPYVCSECGAAFNQTCNLLRHQRIHAGEKRYKCSSCVAAFVQSCDLAKHVKIHSGTGPLECNVCLYKTTWKTALKSHIKKWHSDQINTKTESV